MKKFSPCTIFALSALCLMPWVNAIQAHAGTVTLTLENVGPGNNSGGVYTYPYNFSIDGSSTYSPLMCFAYEQEIYEGETWTATIVPITAGSAADYKELAYLYNVANNPNSSANTVSAAQWAAWELFDSNLTTAPDPPSQASVNTELSAAATFIQTASASYYNSVVLYIPVAGSEIPNNDGLPQSFIGDPPPTPEPSSLVLLGSGLLLFAVMISRRRGVVQTAQI